MQDKEVFTNLLSVFTTQLETIDPLQIIDFLEARKVISDGDLEEIRQVNVNDGPKEAMFLLLDLIARKKENWFGTFMCALNDTDYGHLVKMIAPEFLDTGECKIHFTFK